MIVFGLAEVSTGFTHKFFGLFTGPAISTCAGVAIAVASALNVAELPNTPK